MQSLKKPDALRSSFISLHRKEVDAAVHDSNIKIYIIIYHLLKVCACSSSTFQTLFFQTTTQHEKATVKARSEVHVFIFTEALCLPYRKIIWLCFCVFN